MALNFQGLRKIKNAYIGPERRPDGKVGGLAITKSNSTSGNDRIITLNGKKVGWSPYIPRDELQGLMKALDGVEDIVVAGVEQLNPSWTNQEIPLRDGHSLSLAVNRVKGRETAWIWRIDHTDPENPLLVSAQVAKGSIW